MFNQLYKFSFLDRLIIQRKLGIISSSQNFLLFNLYPKEENTVLSFRQILAKKKTLKQQRKKD